MYYDDEGRRFNVVTGLLFGTLLGAGLTLLVTPQNRVPRRLPKSRGVSRTARRVRRETEGALDSLKGRVVEAITASLAEAWKGAR